MQNFEAPIRPDIREENVRAELTCKREPYWLFLSHCRHIGYQKHAGRFGYWVARFRTKHKGYRSRRIGIADCPGFPFAKVMPYPKAVEAAEKWFKLRKNVALAADAYPVGPCESLKICPIGDVYSVGHALQDYIEWKRISTTPDTFLVSVSLINCHIVPRLSHIALEEFTGLHHRDFAKAVLETPPRQQNRPAGPRRPISELSVDDLRKRKKALNTMTSILRVAFQLAWENGRIESERPLRCLRRVPNVDIPRYLHLTREECRDLMSHCRDDLRQLVLGALYTGCRATELIRMTVRDVARDGYGVYVAPIKNYRPRFVFLPDEGMAFFLRQCEGKNPDDLVFPRKDGRIWPRRQYCDLFRVAVRAASIPDEFTFHGLRHTYASQLVQSGTPLSAVADQLGHADTYTVSRTYGHLAPQIRESEVRHRFSCVDYENEQLAEERAPALEDLRKHLHGPDWRTYANITDRSSWPRANLFRADPELLALFGGNAFSHR
jgi:integrase